MTTTKRKLLACAMAFVLAFSMVSASAMTAFADLVAAPLVAQSSSSADVVYDDVYGVFGGEYALMMKTVTYEAEYNGAMREMSTTITDVVKADGTVKVHSVDASSDDDAIPGEWSDYRIGSVAGGSNFDLNIGYVSVTNKETGKQGVKTAEGAWVIPAEYDTVSWHSDIFVGVRIADSKVKASIMDLDGDELKSIEFDAPDATYAYVSDLYDFLAIQTYGSSNASYGVVIVKEGSEYKEVDGAKRFMDVDEDGNALLLMKDGSVVYMPAEGASVTLLAREGTEAEINTYGSFVGGIIQVDDYSSSSYADRYFDRSGKELDFGDTSTPQSMGEYVLFTSWGGGEYKVYGPDAKLVHSFTAASAGVMGDGEPHYWSIVASGDSYQMEIHAADGTLVKNLGPVENPQLYFRSLSGTIYDDDGEPSYGIIGYGLQYYASESDSTYATYYDLDFNKLDSRPDSTLKLADGTVVNAVVTGEWDSELQKTVYTAKVTNASGEPVKLGGYTLDIAVDSSRARYNSVKHGDGDIWWATDGEGHWGAVDSTGAVVVPFKYESYYDAGERYTDYALVKEDGVWKFLQVSGEGAGATTTPQPAADTALIEKVSPFFGVAMASGLSDLPAGEWYTTQTVPGTSTTYLDYVIGKGLMQGTSDTTFDPVVTLSRAQAAMVLYRLGSGEVGNGPSEADANGFADVNDNDWYTAAVNWCVAHEVMNGTGNGAFSPYEPVTRAQMATMVGRYLHEQAGLEYPEYDSSAYADASSIPSYAEQGVALCAEQGIMAGDGTNFSPDQATQRCMMAKIITMTDLQF